MSFLFANALTRCVLAENLTAWIGSARFHLHRNFTIGKWTWLPIPHLLAPMTPLRQIRLAILIVIFGLVLSGVTAFPLLHELNFLSKILAGAATDPSAHTGFVQWILRVREGLEETYKHYPFIAYGTDWLAFAHLMIAAFFVLPWRDPVRYAGVLWVGIFCSLMIFPLAFICGPIRGIPLWWSVIDCSFGVFCILPLWFALRKIRLISIET
tara:strand:+ start:18875 stop:19507 length:633 start_codon:yes stop_codon:yes gene_type:complete